MWKLALRSAKRGWTLQRGARGSVRPLSTPFKSATSSEKQRLEAIRKQGESKRRAYSFEKREQARPVQFILQVSDDVAGTSPAEAENGANGTEPGSEAAFTDVALSSEPALSVEEAESPAEDEKPKEAVDFEPIPADVYTVDNVTQAQRVVALLIDLAQ